MLGKKPTPTVVEKPTDKIDTLIGPNTEIKGDVVFSGGLRVDGKLTGNISAQDTSNKSLLTVSEQGEVSGNVLVPHVVINGLINGNVTSSGKVLLQSKAKIVGDVYYSSIEMELGATVNGSMVCETARESLRKDASIASIAKNDTKNKILDQVTRD
ncbi:MAG: polymer-forming cytoskeletal protein [Gammaproteobacteria bacterium]|nr:polymer-forming cytoskeletal protein [Gammaproteobacteria bacterium]